MPSTSTIGSDAAAAEQSDAAAPGEEDHEHISALAPEAQAEAAEQEPPPQAQGPQLKSSTQIISFQIQDIFQSRSQVVCTI
jgi:hypothetical protein